MKLEFLANLFKDRKGRIVIWQWPNVPVLAWAILGIASHVLARGKLQTVAQELSRAFLFVWAYLEITDGVSYFRRMLGTVVLVALIHGFFA